jgi:hypothetical protein
MLNPDINKTVTGRSSIGASISLVLFLVCVLSAIYYIHVANVSSQCLSQTTLEHSQGCGLRGFEVFGVILVSLPVLVLSFLVSGITLLARRSKKWPISIWHTALFLVEFILLAGFIYYWGVIVK